MSTRFTYKQRKLSDLIAKEGLSSYAGWARKVFTVTLTAGQSVVLGSLLVRAKGTDGAAKWKLVSAQADLAETNEYAVAISDYLGEQKDITGAGDHEVTTIYVGPVVIKDATLEEAVKTAFAAVSAADMASIKRLLAVQGIVAEVTIKG